MRGRMVSYWYSLASLLALSRVGAADEIPPPAGLAVQQLRRLPANVCGDDKCRAGETCANCPVDCCPTGGAPTPAPAPSDGGGGGGGGLGSFCAPGTPNAWAVCTSDSDCGGSSCNDDPTSTCSNDDQCPPNSGPPGNRGFCVVSFSGSCLPGTAPPTVSLAPTPAVTSTPTRSPVEGTFVTVSSAADISVAMATAQPGDTLIMTDGTWTNEDIVFSGIGSPGNPITLRAETPGSVILTGSSRLRLSGSHLVVDGLNFRDGTIGSGQHVVEFRTSSSTSDYANHCRLTNTAIVNYNPPNSATDYRWVGLYGTINRVDSCYFSGKNHQGPLLIVWRPDDAENFHTIENNYFGDFASGGGKNGWETIRIGTSSTSLSDSSTIVHNNMLLRCDGEIEIISVKSGNNILSGNTFDSCEGMLTLRHGRGNLVDGNFFLGRGLADTGGVRVIDSDHVVTNNYLEGLRGTSARGALVLANGLANSALNEYFPVERATVAFNTVYDCAEPIRIGWRASSNGVAVTDSVIANNAVRALSASEIFIEEDPPVNMLYEGNYVFGATRLGLDPAPAGIYEVDPLLVSDGGVDPQLHRPDVGGGSPCVGGAEGSYPAVTTDMDGQSRPLSSPDVGADQVSSLDPVTSSPLSLADVGVAIGPGWM